jgi:GTP pyrophosphokinase
MPILGKKFDEAFLWAHELHGSQGRKGTSRPYIGHLMSVCSIVLSYGGDEEQAIAALLHDAAEDCGGHKILAEINTRLGPRVAAIVEGCTDTFDSPKPAWRMRKESYIAHVVHATPDVLLVSAADKLSNVREITQDYRIVGEEVWDRFSGGREGTLWYYRALVSAFQQAASHADASPSLLALMDELDRSVTILESLAGKMQATP